jgi:replicative DNA helicase
MSAIAFDHHPSSLAAERTVLGAILLDPEAMLRIRDQLAAEDFLDPVNRRIFAACVELFDQRRIIDLVMLDDLLKADAEFDRSGGMAYLAELPTLTPTASLVEQHAEIVREKANLRALARTGQRIAGLGFQDDAPFVDLLGTAQEAILALTDRSIRQAPEPLVSVTKRRYEVFAEVKVGGDQEAKRRLWTGFSNVDYYFNGFEPTSLVIVAGRPGMGKTALMLNYAVNAAKRYGKRVLFFSLEMSKEQLADRIVAGDLGLSMWQMQRGLISDEQMRSFGRVVDEQDQLPLYVDDDPDSSLTNIRARALRHQLEVGVDAIFVDYLQLIEPPARVGKNANRTEQVSAISRELKRLARELKVPIIAGCQLSRAAENRPQNIPQLADLRESGTIEQDADVVLMLWREGYYNEDCEQPDLTTVFIRKNRQGPTGAAELMFNKELMRFAPLQR